MLVFHRDDWIGPNTVRSSCWCTSAGRCAAPADRSSGKARSAAAGPAPGERSAGACGASRWPGCSGPPGVLQQAAGVAVVKLELHQVEGGVLQGPTCTGAERVFQIVTIYKGRSAGLSATSAMSAGFPRVPWAGLSFRLLTLRRGRKSPRSQTLVNEASIQHGPSFRPSPSSGKFRPGVTPMLSEALATIALPRIRSGSVRKNAPGTRSNNISLWLRWERSAAT